MIYLPQLPVINNYYYYQVIIYRFSFKDISEIFTFFPFLVNLRTCFRQLFTCCKDQLERLYLLNFGHCAHFAAFDIVIYCKSSSANGANNKKIVLSTYSDLDAKERAVLWAKQISWLRFGGRSDGRAVKEYLERKIDDKLASKTLVWK